MILLREMCWATTDKFSDANHHPVVVLENDSTFNFLVKQLRQGKYCSWMLLHRMTPMEIIYIIIVCVWEPKTYKGVVEIESDKQGMCVLHIPEDVTVKFSFNFRIK